MNVDKMLKKCRRSRRITQFQLAERSGVSIPTISYAENKKRNITVDVLSALLNAMDYDLAIVDKKGGKIIVDDCGGKRI